MSISTAMSSRRPRTNSGRIDALVNVAAIADRGTILDTDPTLFERMLTIKTRAPFFLMQDTIKLMIETQTAGTIVNISSMSAIGGQPFIAAYCASKGAVDTLTRNTAFALLKNCIRVNALNIGWMSSDGEDRVQREHHGADVDWLEKAAARQPFGRLVDPANVARLPLPLLGVNRPYDRRHDQFRPIDLRVCMKIACIRARRCILKGQAKTSWSSAPEASRDGEHKGMGCTSSVLKSAIRAPDPGSKGDAVA